MDFSRLPAPMRQELEARLAVLPVQYREVLAARLAKLRPEQIEKMLEKSSPLLDRLIAAAGGGQVGSAGGASNSGASNSGTSSGRASSGRASNAGTSSGGASSGASSVVGGPTRRISAALIPGAKTHYNTTVQRGDSPMPSMGAMLIVLLGLAVIAWNLGWLQF